MIKITIIALGRLKEKYLRDASAEYEKRLESLCRLNIVELEPEKLGENPSENEIQKALLNEAKKIKSKIPDGCAIIPLCIEGKQFDSEIFADKINNFAISGTGHLCFVIGSSYGLSTEIKNMATLKMSMSAMTFPHQLARVMLLEQIYRAFKINCGGTYHK